MKPVAPKNFSIEDKSPIAFFCAEYAITLDESMYAGGLGVLAGDFLFEAGDEKMPFIALGLKYDKTKTTENGFELLVNTEDKPILIEVPIGEKVGGKKIFLQSWVKRFSDNTFLFLLDTTVENNAPQDRIMGDLYDQNFTTRLRQEIFLGIGGFRLLKALGVTPKKYHLNEGSVAFGALAVLAEDCGNVTEKVQAKVVSTKHTILSVGMKMSATDLWNVAGSYCQEFGINKDFLMSLGAYKSDQNLFSTTAFLLKLSGKSNGVSVIHTVFEKRKHPESRLIPITNGVYVPRWQSPLWNKEGNATDLSAQKIWMIKNELRKDLIEYVNKLLGVNLSPDVCTLVWTRRFVPYKRPLAIFTDMARLKEILLNASHPLQIIISGKMAGTDHDSIQMMEKVRAAAQDPIFQGKIAFVADYSLPMAQKFVMGADIWLNTPERGVEACGTSGMKAGLNGALMASVSDGWMDEVNWRDIGWILSDDTQDLSTSIYEALERHILPEFYAKDAENVPQSWVDRMCATMKIVNDDFSAKKMIEKYNKDLYN